MFIVLFLSVAISTSVEAYESQVLEIIEEKDQVILNGAQQLPEISNLEPGLSLQLSEINIVNKTKKIDLYLLIKLEILGIVPEILEPEAQLIIDGQGQAMAIKKLEEGVTLPLKKFRSLPIKLILKVAGAKNGNTIQETSGEIKYHFSITEKTPIKGKSVSTNKMTFPRTGEHKPLSQIIGMLLIVLMLSLCRLKYSKSSQ